jgi:DNA-binding transcriptional LysR family regulator
MQTGAAYRREFNQGMNLSPRPSTQLLIVYDLDIVLPAAIDGVGLAFLAEEHAKPYVGSGAIVRVIDDWCPPFPIFLAETSIGINRSVGILSLKSLRAAARGGRSLRSVAGCP